MRVQPDAHAPYRELLAARLDRPLTRVELRSLNAHLKQCRNCRQVEADYRAQRDLLRALPKPLPPRDMWARTSAALDREVARGMRPTLSRRVRWVRRHAQPQTGLLTTLAAMAVVTALALFQVGPAFVPGTAAPARATPFAVSPRSLAFVGVGDDIAIYHTVVRQVCPASVPIDCVESESIERVPLGTGLPAGLQAGNIALSPTRERLVLVGHSKEADVFAVVLMPGQRDPRANPTESVGTVEPTDIPATPAPTEPPPATPEPTDVATPANPSSSELPTNSPTTSDTPAPETPSATPTADPTPEPTPAATPAPPVDSPPASVVPGPEVVNILDGVRSVGAPPAWSPDGALLAFSAMPVDASHGPDVYIWSPGEARAHAITSDHNSYFASWSGDRVVVSRPSGSGSSASTQTFVVDPASGEERSVAVPQIWLPVVSADGSRAIAWSGELALDDGRPVLRSGALYVLDWTRVDPFRTPESTPGASNSPTKGPDSAGDVALVPLETDADASTTPVVDWVARWSPDTRVLGVWIADSLGSPWGRLTVVAVDPETRRLDRDDPLLDTTLARRGFSLASDGVAWVAASDDNVDGELRIRAWTSDGVGGLRVVAADREEVLPAW